MTPLTTLAAEPRSAEVTDWTARLGWVGILLLFVALAYWLMRQGWKWRADLQSALPEPPTAPETPGEAILSLEGRYHGSTVAGQWLERIVAHGLGVRSRAELTLTDAGLQVLRPGATDFFIPADRLRGARLDTGIAGKVLTEGGLLVVTWAHGDQLIDSGFRSDRAAEHPAWVTAVNSLSSPSTENTTTEGAAR
ncbi:hypothetical protein M4914_02545 [Streptomyces somaliensis DSM 40738]|uniref:PH domain-containing protein n=1 Tax=Streptomyces somaliensis (strain ATCC 33201 / DSM 40738 / JCM 12659 / KCTC 9044 / NCTC 11332 / NRRL B-12077 / IP 733) TaxID=1134445 RepID=A0AA44DCE5_STRE0|nr:hypothetical protein [Streptomyces somaliensis]MCQ0021947.1 hypothetical protein [Streptomyces somaliensis DSM 40738]NKY13878.1 hypothetical protein [Streptomyces somaliensis DSM 40738]